MRINLPLYFAIEAYNIKKSLYDIPGFMNQTDLESVLEWEYPVPIILSIEEKEYKKIDIGQIVNLYFDNIKIAEMEVEEKFAFYSKEYAKKLYKNPEHPGYRLFLTHHTDFAISGKIFDKKSSRLELPWKTVTGFQTRNIPHIGHEKLHKKALEMTEGLLLTPVLGIKNPGDFKNLVIKDAYSSYVQLLENTQLQFLFLNMRYLGPREAIFHSIIRKNLGCTHFVVGRDHAGIAGMYKPYEAYEVAKSYAKDIKIIGVKEVGYCKSCNAARELGECNHKLDKISGTKLREKLKKGEFPAPYLRKEVFDSIKKHSSLFVNSFKEDDIIQEFQDSI